MAGTRSRVGGEKARVTDGVRWQVWQVWQVGLASVASGSRTEWAGKKGRREKKGGCELGGKNREGV